MARENREAGGVRFAWHPWCYRSTAQLAGLLRESGHPNASFLGGGTNGAVTNADFTGSLRLDGLSPKAGGSYRLDFSSIRSTTNNQFAALVSSIRRRSPLLLLSRCGVVCVLMAHAGRSKLHARIFR